MYKGLPFLYKWDYVIKKGYAIKRKGLYNQARTLSREIRNYFMNMITVVLIKKSLSPLILRVLHSRAFLVLAIDFHK